MKKILVPLALNIFLHGISKTRNPGFRYPICHYSLPVSPMHTLFSWLVLDSLLSRYDRAKITYYYIPNIVKYLISLISVGKHKQWDGASLRKLG